MNEYSNGRVIEIEIIEKNALMMIVESSTHFAKVSNGMTTLWVADSHNVKEERLDIVV